MTLAKKFAVAAVFCLSILGAIAVLGWQFIQHRIALNEQAPGLVRINQSADNLAKAIGGGWDTSQLPSF